MFSIPKLRGLFSFSLLMATQLHAQPTATTPRPDPLDPKTNVPALRYESSLESYRRLSDQKPVSWREANDTVARMGGWRVYLREAQTPAPSASAPAKVAP
jgi:hypothetical protein